MNVKAQPKKSTVQTIQKGNERPIILVVEDNAYNMLTVKALLQNDDVIIEATDGMEGVEMANTHKPHLILMDIALPNMDGIEAFKMIRKQAHLEHIPIIALNASAMKKERETILEHGFDHYISKPIDEKQFFMILNEVLYGK